MTKWFIVTLLVAVANGDCYMQHPRGSNNKLNEQSNTVTNNQRLFDSQNNDNSGYQHGDNCIPNCLSTDGNNQYQPDYPGAGEGVMQFYEGSWLWIEWNNQHGSQSPYLHNQIILQYTCDDTKYTTGMRDGKTTNKIPTDPTAANIDQYGQHENQQWYSECTTRNRNGGLYTADQNLQGTTAQYTRQNAAGTRHGLECPEERDYYPYWHPTPWRDIAVCTDTPTQCPYYQQNSQNVVNLGSCSNPLYNNQKDCQYNLASWTESGAWNVGPPNCTICPTTRNNHNGNAVNSGQSPNYMWQIPQGIHADGATCVLRIRYNVTTYDFGSDSWNVFSAANGANSPVKTNPASDFVGLGANITGPLRLNVNTAQFGRTFQDRSHVFQIRKRPSNLPCGLRTNDACNIYNLNVRGRRGNIQQTYPAVEYDFVPPNIQWTGSDANDQNNAGNGRTGTDRNNIVIIGSVGKNYPTSLNPLLQTNSTPIHFSNDNNKIALMAYLNQTGCDYYTTDTNNNNNCKTLNRAAAYQNIGLVQAENLGKFTIMSTRNNAFSNREQKTTITVAEDPTTIGGGIGIGLAGIGIAAACGFFGFSYAKKHPKSKMAQLYGVCKTNDIDDETASQSDVDSNADLLEAAPKKTIFDKVPLLAAFAEWYSWNQPLVFFFVFFTLCQIGAWLYGYFINLNVSPLPYFPYAKGFGKMLDFNLCFVLIPVLRNFLSFVRTTAVADKLPLDDNLNIHRWTAYTISLAACGHIGFHFADFLYSQNYLAVPIYISALANVAGPTGFVITFLMIIMFLTAFLKRKIYSLFGHRFDGYKLFLKIHKLWMPIYVLMWFHGSQFWQFSVFPLLFLLLEKYIQSRRAKLDVKIVEAKMAGKDVLSLKMQLLNGRKKFRYKAGQYLFLCVPEINETEFHPFTITSAPEDNYFSCHIRCRKDMDWTYSLRQTLGFAEQNPGEMPLVSRSPVTPEALGGDTDNEDETSGLVLRVDGPYGSASEEVFDYETVILVGAGIGVTPFISIIKSLSYRMQLAQGDDNAACMSIYFYWICRDQAEFDSFKDFFDQILKIDRFSNHLELNMYVTGEVNLKNVKVEAYNQFAGRPNWNRIFKEKAKKHAGTEIGVFLCGPGPIAQQLAAASKLHSTKRNKHLHTTLSKRTLFKFHKENF
ncbi:hypothetical protein HDV06_002339 [Boothiomyces sp. JEL0866]|nr:hypothetical protein HDV06_002339 [Boothiomyces sp. JEL0866]